MLSHIYTVQVAGMRNTLKGITNDMIRQMHELQAAQKAQQVGSCLDNYCQSFSNEIVDLLTAQLEIQVLQQTNAVLLTRIGSLDAGQDTLHRRLSEVPS
jgi:hypothetical protein